MNRIALGSAAAVIAIAMGAAGTYALTDTGSSTTTTAPAAVVQSPPVATVPVVPASTTAPSTGPASVTPVTAPRSVSVTPVTQPGPMPVTPPVPVPAPSPVPSPGSPAAPVTPPTVWTLIGGTAAVDGTVTAYWRDQAGTVTTHPTVEPGDDGMTLDAENGAPAKPEGIVTATGHATGETETNVWHGVTVTWTTAPSPAPSGFSWVLAAPVTWGQTSG